MDVGLLDEDVHSSVMADLKKKKCLKNARRFPFGGKKNKILKSEIGMKFNPEK